MRTRTRTTDRAASAAKPAAGPATPAPQPPADAGPLLPLPPGCLTAAFVARIKRFTVELRPADDSTLLAHSNNSGSMLGLLRPGAPVLVSPATRPGRTLRYTQECVWLEDHAVPAPSARAARAARAAGTTGQSRGFWVGVNTSVPNRMLEAAFRAGRLDFAAGYTALRREARRGQSRLDACLTGPGLPPLWVECKNVTLVEDDAACFPDAASERARKHLTELMDIVASGQRAAMFYLVQRPDGRCFGPADCIDPDYAALFWQAVERGVEICAFRAHVSPAGIDLGPRLPLRPRGCGVARA